MNHLNNMVNETFGNLTSTTTQSPTKLIQQQQYLTTTNRIPKIEQISNEYFVIFYIVA